MKNRIMAAALAGMVAIGTIGGSGLTALACSNELYDQLVDAHNEVVNEYDEVNELYCSPYVAQNSSIEAQLEHDANYLNTMADIRQDQISDVEALQMMYGYETIQQNLIDILNSMQAYR